MLFMRNLIILLKTLPRSSTAKTVTTIAKSETKADSSTLFFDTLAKPYSSSFTRSYKTLSDKDNTIMTPEGPIVIKRATYEFDPKLEKYKDEPERYFEAFLKKNFGDPLPANTMFVFVRPTHFPNIIEVNGRKEVRFPIETGHIFALLTNEKSNILPDLHIDFTRSSVPTKSQKRYTAIAKLANKADIEYAYITRQPTRKGHLIKYGQRIQKEVELISPLSSDNHSQDIAIIALPGFDTEALIRIQKGLEWIKGKFIIEDNKIITETPYILSTAFIEFEKEYEEFLSSGRNCDVIFFHLANLRSKKEHLKDYEAELSSAYPVNALVLLIHNQYGYDAAANAIKILSTIDKFKQNLLTSDRYSAILSTNKRDDTESGPKLV